MNRRIERATAPAAARRKGGRPATRALEGRRKLSAMVPAELHAWAQRETLERRLAGAAPESDVARPYDLGDLLSEALAMLEKATKKKKRS